MSATRNADVRSRLATLVGRLRAKYGPPAPPPAKTAFELVAWEKVAYLASDEKRANAFALLGRKIGLTPRKILAASRSELIDVLAAGGIAAPERANNLIKAAELVIGDFDGSLDDLCRGPLREAKKQLMRIHGIGEPGAEKILLLTRSHPVLGLDSNALRVLTRLGYGAAAKSYTTTYRSATAAALPELGSDIETLVDANLLLRAHGQTVCKTTAPRCGACVIRADCPSAR
jgi:endonuclease III